MKRIPIKTPAGHVWLDVKAFVAKRKLPAHLFATLERAEVTVIQHGEDMLFQLALRVPGKEVEVQEALYPADWWSHFRHRWFKTRLFKAVFGAPRWERITLRAEAAYPSLHVPNHKPFVQVTLKKENT